MYSSIARKQTQQREQPHTLEDYHNSILLAPLTDLKLGAGPDVLLDQRAAHARQFLPSRAPCLGAPEVPHLGKHMPDLRRER
jgi:hypothetical protein